LKKVRRLAEKEDEFKRKKKTFFSQDPGKEQVLNTRRGKKTNGFKKKNNGMGGKTFQGEILNEGKKKGLLVPAS